MICPIALGYDNEPNDEQITEDYFEQEGFDYKSYMPDMTEEQWSHKIFDDTDKVFYIDALALWGSENLLYGGMNENDTQKDILLQDLNRRSELEGYYISKQ